MDLIEKLHFQRGRLGTPEWAQIKANPPLCPGTPLGPPQRPLRGPKEAPKGPPRGPQEAPKRPQRDPPEAPKRPGSIKPRPKTPELLRRSAL